MKEVKTTSYKRPDIEKGYTNQTLHINISDAAVSIKLSKKRQRIFFISL
jgi:hypothetical protein